MVLQVTNLFDELFMFFGPFGDLNGLFRQNLLGFNSLFRQHLFRLSHSLRKSKTTQTQKLVKTAKKSNFQTEHRKLNPAIQICHTLDRSLRLFFTSSCEVPLKSSIISSSLDMFLTCARFQREKFDGLREEPTREVVARHFEYIPGFLFNNTPTVSILRIHRINRVIF